MGRVSPRRALIVAAVVCSGCSAKHQPPPLAVTQVEAGRAAVRAIGADSLGPVDLAAVAVTNGLAESSVAPRLSATGYGRVTPERVPITRDE